MKKLLLIFAFIAFVITAKAQTADEYFEKGDYKKALEGYKQVLAKDRFNLIALRRSAYIYSIAEGWESKAHYLFTQALKVAPNDIASNYYYGLMLVEEAKKSEKPNFENAKIYLEKAASLGSEDAKLELEKIN